MRVFYAYLFKENAEFADVDRAREYLADLREKFIKWVPKDMVRWDSFYRNMKDQFDVIEALEKDTKQPEKGGFACFSSDLSQATHYKDLRSANSKKKLAMEKRDKWYDKNDEVFTGKATAVVTIEEV